MTDQQDPITICQEIQRLARTRNGLIPWECISLVQQLAAAPDIERPRVPEGWQLVPKKPTDAMVEAALQATSMWLRIQGSQLTVNREKAARRYRAMLACAPSPSEESKP